MSRCVFAYHTENKLHYSNSDSFESEHIPNASTLIELRLLPLQFASTPAGRRNWRGRANLQFLERAKIELNFRESRCYSIVYNVGCARAHLADCFEVDAPS